jgi:hypothetical protein
MNAKNQLVLIAMLLLAAPLMGQVQVTVVDMIPNAMSNETVRDAEPNVTANPANPLRIAASAFTPDPGASGIGPVFISTDGGNNWDVRTILTGGNRTVDATLRFGGLSGVLYAGIIRSDNTQANILRKADFTLNGAAEILSNRANDDQPWVEAATLMRGSAPDRFFMGSNDNVSPADVDQSQNIATAAPPAGLATFGVDGTALCRDAPAVRPAIHGSGRIYVAYLRWNDCSGTFPTGDVVVARDDNWASSAPRYQALMTGPSPGVSVAAGRTFPFLDTLGSQRVGSTLAIAVDPSNRDVVYVAWGEGNSGPNQELHLRRSIDGGAMWSADLRVIANATNPGLAVNSLGVVGFLYQRNTGGMNARWETHFEYSDNGFTTGQTDVLIANLPDQVGSYGGVNPIGDYANVVAAGKNFYGVFSGFNLADTANFPQGVSYLRNHDFAAKKLRNVANSADVAESIDPFFFRVRMLPPEKDFYARDWNNGVTGDDGTEPSTHPVFYQTADVWNRRGTLPGMFGANDPPPNEDAGNGAGNIGDNWAFARIRRNAPSAGISAANVNAHFLVSQFGTGSAYSDDTTMNPDLTFDPDTSVSFLPAEVGPKITAASHWTLAPTASTHICLAVEISTTDDPYVAPSLANQWPGWSSGTDLRVLADNNKAQKNMGLSITPARGIGLSDSYFAIVHNAAPFTRDLELAFEVEPPVARKLRPLLAVAGEQPIQIGKNDSTILRDMTPGENRWVEVRFDAADIERDELLPIHFFERFAGVPVNGFTIAARGGSLEEAIAQKLALHRSVFTRLAALGVKGAEAEVRWADAGGKRIAPAKYVGALRRGSLRQLLRTVAKVVLPIAARDPSFHLDESIAAFNTSVDSGDATRTVLAHSALLNALDAAITRSRLEGGAAADIVTTIAWQRELFGQTPRLAKLSCAGKAAEAAAQYVDAIGRRRITNRDYPGFLHDAAECFAETASYFGSDELKKNVAAIEEAGDDLLLAQRAHRSFLLTLDRALQSRSH